MAESFGAVACVLESVAKSDYGDAPATYGSPSHAIFTGLQIGSTAPDDETAPVAPLDGTGDGADETGLVLPTLNAGATTYQIPNIPVTNNTGSVAKLVGWVDFRRYPKKKVPMIKGESEYPIWEVRDDALKTVQLSSFVVWRGRYLWDKRVSLNEQSD